MKDVSYNKNRTNVLFLGENVCMVITLSFSVSELITV